MKKKIAILGSTGSIGTQSLEVIKANSANFEVVVLTAYKNVDLLLEQALIFKPKYVVIGDSSQYTYLKSQLIGQNTTVWQGKKALEEVVQIPEIDTVLTALVGYSGFLPTLAAIKAQKNIALANKETLVVGGEIIMALAKEKQVNIYPVDSEHSAIFQCLQGEKHKSIERLILTASGGPFRKTSLEDLQHVTLKQALKHPNWNMGAKITIDSASMMNKGLELIEAHWLFDIPPEKIDIIIHRQSIIHSMVQFQDSSIIAQMGYPDMKLPIIYALSYPERLKTDFKRFNFADYPSLNFELPDKKRFHNLTLAFEALKQGGNMPCILNAANEMSVELFLKAKIGFLEIAKINEICMQKIDFIDSPTYCDLIQTHEASQRFAKELGITKLLKVGKFICFFDKLIWKCFF